MATRSGRAVRRFKNYAASKYEYLFAALFKSGLRFNGFDKKDGLTDEIIATYLYEKGAVAEDKLTGVWLPFYGQGHPNVYGIYPEYRLYGNNGVEITRKYDDIRIFTANSECYPVEAYIREKAAVLASFDAAINQNLNAIKQIAVIVCETKALARALASANAKREAGESTVILSREEYQDFAELQTLSTQAQYNVTQLLDDKRKVFEEVLHIVGIRTPILKGERKIVSEQESENAEVDAYIKLLVLSFENCAKHYGVNYTVDAYVAGVDGGAVPLEPRENVGGENITYVDEI